jgi:hypothetical protein
MVAVMASTQPRKKTRPSHGVVISFYVPDEKTRERIHRVADAEGALPTVWIREIIMQRVRAFETKSGGR